MCILSEIHLPSQRSGRVKTSEAPAHTSSLGNTWEPGHNLMLNNVASTDESLLISASKNDLHARVRNVQFWPDWTKVQMTYQNVEVLSGNNCWYSSKLLNAFTKNACITKFRVHLH
jgi:hypothetical protein